MSFTAKSMSSIQSDPLLTDFNGSERWSGSTKKGVRWEICCGDAQEVLQTYEAGRFSCVVTSPPYFSQRDYQVEGQIGLEKTIEDYVTRITDAFDEVRRVLSPTGVLFLNLGDTYYSGKGQPKGGDRKNVARRFGLRAVDASGLGVPRKTTIGIPWRVALEMVGRGWILRSPIIWLREGSIPEPTAHDRPWRTYEMLFMFSKEPRYYFDRTKLGGDEDVWTVSKRPRHARGVHSAAFPDELVEKCLDVGCPEEGEVLDPFAGSGTVLRVALSRCRSAVGIDLSKRYCQYMTESMRSL